MASTQPIGTLAECYAQALMIEREAAERCTEFAEFLEDHGALSTAAVFRKLARYEQQHAEELARRAEGFPQPHLRQWEFSWLDDAPPEQVSHEFIFHLMTPYHALRIALDAEQRSRALFEHLSAASDHPEVRSLSRQLADEESEHVEWLQDALVKVPRPPVSEADFERMLGHG
jgi:rubrerythrin